MCYFSRIRLTLLIIWVSFFFAKGAIAQDQTCRVVLDVGHSPAHPGAISSRGITEFSFNYTLTKLIEARLGASGVEAQVIVDTAGVLTPAKRARLAERSGANLLLSVHHDSVQPQDLSTWSVNGGPQFYTDRASGFSLFVSDRGEEQSRAFVLAKMISYELQKIGRAPNLYHARRIPGEGRLLLDTKSGIYSRPELGVLSSRQVPSVLVEIGVILNRNEEADLAMDFTKERIAGAIVNSLEHFCRGG